LKEPGNCANLFPKQSAGNQKYQVDAGIVERVSHVETNLESTGEKAGG